jgi:putative serine protease PepD
MNRIQVQTASRIWTFDERKVLHVGSSPDADVKLDRPGISPLHAELRPTDAGWELHDCATESGTWVNNERVADTTLGPSTPVRFGGPADGVEAIINIGDPSATSAKEATPEGEGTDTDATWVYTEKSSARLPTGGILIRSRDGDKRFVPGSTVRIGRDAGLEVVADDQLVSRNHAMLEHRPDGWWYQDTSRSGSYIDGERITGKKIAEPTEVHLGHPTAGYTLSLVPMVDISAAQRSIAAKRRRTMAIRIASIVGVLVLVGAGATAAVLLSGRGQEQNTLSAAHLERAKRASVQIVATDADGTPLWKGSGTIISPNGLILTNAHVGHPSVLPPGNPDRGPDASVYLIALAKDDASPAVPKYRATPIVADGYLDIAVMKIIGKDDGSALPPAPLGLPEAVPIGDSNALHTGDRITALGYPALTASQGVVAGPLTITSGDVASFESDPDTNTDRFWIDSTERIGSGNSGGASIDNAGEVVGINSAVVAAESSGGNLGEFTSGSSLIRPVALAADVIRIARNGGDPNYVSPYLARLPHLEANASATSAGWTKTRSEDCNGTSTEQQPQTLQGVAPGDVVFANFQVAGIPNSTPFTIAFIADDKKTILFKSQSKWKLGPKQQCVDQDLKVIAGLTGAYAILIIGPQNEISVTNPVKFSGP